MKSIPVPTKSAANGEVSILPPDEATELQTMPTARLRKELSATLDLTARTLRRLAAIVRILEDRGEDLSDLRLGFLGYVRQIAHGQVAPEVVIRFAESPMLIRRVAALPMPDQIRLASGEPVTLVVPKPDGRFDRRLADPLKMGRDQIVQVFGPTGIRDEAEQILSLEAKSRAGARRKPARNASGNVAVDRRRGGIVVGKTFVPVADVLAALAMLADDSEDRDDDFTEQVNFRLTAKEKATLHSRAIESATSMNLLVRRALIVSGLLASE